jgi:tol-pal system protein YbgF
MRFPVRAISVLSLLFGFAVMVPPALAQSDSAGMVDRLDRLERDLNALQSQVYRGVGGRPPAAPPADGGGGLGSGAYGVLDGRLTAIEEQVRELTSQIEKTQFTLNQLSTKLDRTQTDNEFRFKQLEDKVAAAPVPVPVPMADAAAPKPSAPDVSGAKTADAGPGFLVRPPGDKPSAPPPPSAKPAAEQYDDAFSLLRNNDYDGAAKGFHAFLAQHPQDPLAGNAAYWLGQISFAQGHYDQAAVIFLDAYQKYPKSAKAAESLLKVGLSMGNLDKKKEACAALRRFQTEYPDASDTLKRQATAERQKQGC